MRLSHLGRHVLIVGFLLALTSGAAAQGANDPLRGLAAFREGNQLYQRQDFKGAAAKYEETIAICRGSGSDCTDPQLTYAYFFLGNSYESSSVPRSEVKRSTMRC